jgi:hypothetical protein
VIVVGVLVPGLVGDSVVEIARRGATTGARTEVVGVAPVGPDGDRQLLALAAAGVGHATVTRSAAGGIEPADLDLALRYLPDVRAVALVRPAAPLLATAVAASSWSGATLIVIGPLDADATALLDASGAGNGAGAGDSARASSGSSGPILLEPPSRDPDGAFAGVVAALAVRLDAGEDPASAWQSTVAALALDPA